MIITDGKILYYFYSTRRDMMIGEIATEKALAECVDMVGGKELSRKYTEKEIRETMTIVKSVEVTA